MLDSNETRGDPLSKLNELQSAVIGDMDECRMSLYGIHQLLKSRTVGAAQLMPALASLDVMAREHCRSVDIFIACLLAELTPLHSRQERWRPLVEGIGREAAALQRAIIDAVAVRGRLGAKARLEIEGRVVVLRTRLESQRAVSMAVVQALRGHTRACQLCDLFGADSTTAATSEARTVALFLLDDGAELPMLVVEAMRVVIHQELWLLAGQYTQPGHCRLIARWRPEVGLIITLAGAGGAPSLGGTVEQLRRSLHTVSSYETQAVAALAAEMSIVVTRSVAGVTVALPPRSGAHSARPPRSVRQQQRG